MKSPASCPSAARGWRGRRIFAERVLGSAATRNTRAISNSSTVTVVSVAPIAPPTVVL